MKAPLRGLAVALGLALALSGQAFPQEHPDGPPPPAPPEAASPARVRTGLEVFLAHPPDALRGKRVGLITNPSAVDPNLDSAVDLLAADHDIHLTALFAPEHGLYGNAGVRVRGSVDPQTGLPIYSLYGATRSPTPEMMHGLDALIFDVQDVGARFFTYSSTMALAMQAAAQSGIPFVVLDRPNPLGGLMVDGPVLDPRWKSFIGMYPLPILHGMTIGELAGLFNTEFRIGANLIVVRMEGWKRSMYFDETGLPWVLPSPGIPSVETTLLYPALGPVGDTNIDVGVLTTKPFEFAGGEYIEPWRLRQALEARALPGLAFREAYWRGEPWRPMGGPEYAGVEIRLTDRSVYRPVDLTLQILDAVHRLYPYQFRWGPMSEGDYVFDLDMGTDQVRRGIMMGKSPAQIEKEWEPDLARFRAIREKYLLYP
jgi:uncharacterized protein YbbC (DUF1343 family)